jgi:hypothetical protein
MNSLNAYHMAVATDAVHGNTHVVHGSVLKAKPCYGRRCGIFDTAASLPLLNCARAGRRRRGSSKRRRWSSTSRRKARATRKTARRRMRTCAHGRGGWRGRAAAVASGLLRTDKRRVDLEVLAFMEELVRGGKVCDNHGGDGPRRKSSIVGPSVVAATVCEWIGRWRRCGRRWVREDLRGDETKTWVTREPGSKETKPFFVFSDAGPRVF